ncbi:fluoride efflux transporter CrcB [Endozoicomonas sp. OPT23]|uniref:fluoride efflux transporter CrcB n=1 Tax=Endozoicomonas sp. OPT23 TaxID=2072845 RepID=UPI00129A22AC|nr:fluoride efflux transporter CrcB [Endozoicomonas sp. OPT23]MRI34427.1 fluoride efflux transporter CrcB [Endozoicomonas sp. OPT23]
MLATHWIAVAAGGATGALLRAATYELFALTRNPNLHYIPTLAVNVVGSLIMGICFFLLMEKSQLPDVWRIFIMTGLLGALTTFSTFSLDLLRLLQSERMMEALAYGAGSVVICLLGTCLGYYGAKLLS